MIWSTPMVKKAHVSSRSAVLAGALGKSSAGVAVEVIMVVESRVEKRNGDKGNAVDT